MTAVAETRLVWDRIPKASSNKVVSPNRGGDRQLNHALHIIAVTRANHDPATKEYLARKQREGKTKKGALRCLKRYLARRFWRLLAEPPEANPSNPQRPSPAQPAEPEPLEAMPERPAPRREVDRTITGPIPTVCIT
jgi:hypothetical protein